MAKHARVFRSCAAARYRLDRVGEPMRQIPTEGRRRKSGPAQGIGTRTTPPLEARRRGTAQRAQACELTASNRLGASRRFPLAEVSNLRAQFFD